MHYSRREFFKATGAASVALTAPGLLAAERTAASKKSHIVTLSFDDGFSASRPWRSFRRAGRWRSTHPEIGNRPRNETAER